MIKDEGSKDVWGVNIYKNRQESKNNEICGPIGAHSYLKHSPSENAIASWNEWLSASDQLSVNKNAFWNNLL